MQPGRRKLVEPLRSARNLKAYGRRRVAQARDRLPYRTSPAALPETLHLPITHLDDAPAVLSHILEQAMVPFWFPDTVDDEDGGYRLNHDHRGRWRGPGPKYLVTQARHLWFFTRLAERSGNPQYREAADHGFAFLCDRLWDDRHGGFFWAVGRDGNPVAPNRRSLIQKTADHKHLYGQAFALCALSEYAALAGTPAATGPAADLFDLLESRAHDPDHLGYLEMLRRDWALPGPGTTSLVAGAPADAKLFNTHLHLLEGITAYLRLTGDQRAHERVHELITVCSDKVVRGDVGACGDVHCRDWEPFPGNPLVSYGHDLENVSVLTSACSAVGVDDGEMLALYRTLFGNALRFGFDHTAGGFFYAGAPGQPAGRRRKLAWVQAEGLLATLHMLRLTGESQYADCALATLNWIASRQVDWVNGDWHVTIAPNGRPSGSKAGPWSGAFHTARAMTDGADILATLGTAS